MPFHLFQSRRMVVCGAHCPHLLRVASFHHSSGFIGSVKALPFVCGLRSVTGDCPTKRLTPVVILVESLPAGVSLGASVGGRCE